MSSHPPLPALGLRPGDALRADPGQRPRRGLARADVLVVVRPDPRRFLELVRRPALRVALRLSEALQLGEQSRLVVRRQLRGLADTAPLALQHPRQLAVDVLDLA